MCEVSVQEKKVSGWWELKKPTSCPMYFILSATASSDLQYFL